MKSNFPKAAYVQIEGRFRMTPNLELIPTPGHTPGHQSLIIRSGSFVEIIVAQAAYTSAEFALSLNRKSDGSTTVDSPVLEAAVKSNATWSKQAYVSSHKLLRSLRPVRAFFSHDERVWKRTEDNPKSIAS